MAELSTADRPACSAQIAPGSGPGGPGEAVTALAARLAEAAERILRHAPIGPDDDFFDFGCDSVTALALALEVEALTGRTVSPTAIYDAPTANGLAAALSMPAHAADAAPQAASVLVKLKDGDERLPPVLMLPGLGSTAMQLAGLARGLACDNAVFGLEPLGLGDGRQPPERIEDMAADYAEAIAARWPAVRQTGQCHLVGYCYGGVVALALARQLAPEAQGQGAAWPRLTLINSFPHAAWWPLPARLRAWLLLLLSVSPRSLWRRLTGHHLPALRSMRLPQAAAYATRVLWRGVTLPARIFGLGAYVRDAAGDPPAGAALAMPAGLWAVRTAGAVAFRAYRPAGYGGPALLIVGAPGRRVPFDPAPYWRARLPRLAVRQAASEAVDLLAERLAVLCAMLSAFIAEPAGGRPE
jgi:pimeloyl-ACP methyl ester carboxylesterase